MPKVMIRAADSDWLRPLSLLALIWAALTASNDRRREEFGIHRQLILLDWNTHMASISALAAVAFVLTDALVGAKTCIFASLARSLTITALLTLAAALATRFR